jgi:hypothetical protein
VIEQNGAEPFKVMVHCGAKIEDVAVEVPHRYRAGQVRNGA